ncbi:MAG: 6-phosphofructokinase, partial [Candidatus Omnitrophota bacterium]|nr:6-phosphofructokinase [Candidatus Omnitrophota bacterium]
MRMSDDEILGLMPADLPDVQNITRHTLRVGGIAARIAEEMGVEGGDIGLLQRAILAHDIGQTEKYYYKDAFVRIKSGIHALQNDDRTEPVKRHLERWLEDVAPRYAAPQAIDETRKAVAATNDHCLIWELYIAGAVLKKTGLTAEEKVVARNMFSHGASSIARLGDHNIRYTAELRLLVQYHHDYSQLDDILGLMETRGEITPERAEMLRLLESTIIVADSFEQGNNHERLVQLGNKGTVESFGETINGWIAKRFNEMEDIGERRPLEALKSLLAVRDPAAGELKVDTRLGQIIADARQPLSEKAKREEPQLILTDEDRAFMRSVDEERAKPRAPPHVPSAAPIPQNVTDIDPDVLLNTYNHGSLRGHVARATAINMRIGRELGLTEDELKVLEYASTLHDVGADVRFANMPLFGELSEKLKAAVSQDPRKISIKDASNMLVQKIAEAEGMAAVPKDSTARYGLFRKGVERVVGLPDTEIAKNEEMWMSIYDVADNTLKILQTDRIRLLKDIEVLLKYHTDYAQFQKDSKEEPGLMQGLTLSKERMSLLLSLLYLTDMFEHGNNKVTQLAQRGRDRVENFPETFGFIEKKFASMKMFERYNRMPLDTLVRLICEKDKELFGAITAARESSALSDEDLLFIEENAKVRLVPFVSERGRDRETVMAIKVFKKGEIALHAVTPQFQEDMEENYGMLRDDPKGMYHKYKLRGGPVQKVYDKAPDYKHVRKDVWTIERHLAEFRRTHPDLDVVGYVGNGNILANPGSTAYVDGKLYAVEQEKELIHKGQGRSYPSLICWAEDGHYTVEEVSFTPDERVIQRSTGDDITKKILFTNSGIGILRLDPEGRSEPYDLAANCWHDYDVRHYLDFPFIPAGNVHFGVSQFYDDQGKVINGLLAPAINEEPVVLKLETKDDTGRKVALSDEQIQGLISGLTEKGYVQAASEDTVGYGSYYIAEGRGEIKIAFMRGINPHNIAGIDKDGNLVWIIVAGKSNRIGITFKEAQSKLKEMGVVSAVIFDNGADAMMNIAGYYPIPSFQARDRIMSLSVFVNRAPPAVAVDALSPQPAAGMAHVIEAPSAMPAATKVELAAAAERLADQKALKITATDGEKFIFTYEPKPADEYGENVFRIQVTDSRNDNVGYIDVYGNTIDESFDSRWDVKVYDAIEVKPEYRKNYRGIGRALMLLAMSIVSSRNYPDFVVKHPRAAENNRFYLELGFEWQPNADEPERPNLVFKFSKKALPKEIQIERLATPRPPQGVSPEAVEPGDQQPPAISAARTLGHLLKETSKDMLLRLFNRRFIILAIVVTAIIFAFPNVVGGDAIRIFSHATDTINTIFGGIIGPLVFLSVFTGSGLEGDGPTIRKLKGPIPKVTNRLFTRLQKSIRSHINKERESKFPVLREPVNIAEFTQSFLDQCQYSRYLKEVCESKDDGFMRFLANTMYEGLAYAITNPNKPFISRPALSAQSPDVKYPARPLLVVACEDRPGVAGSITKPLGDQGIDIREESVFYFDVENSPGIYVYAATLAERDNRGGIVELIDADLKLKAGAGKKFNRAMEEISRSLARILAKEATLEAVLLQHIRQQRKGEEEVINYEDFAREFLGNANVLRESFDDIEYMKRVILTAYELSLGVIKNPNNAHSRVYASPDSSLSELMIACEHRHGISEMRYIVSAVRDLDLKGNFSFVKHFSDYPQPISFNILRFEASPEPIVYKEREDIERVLHEELQEVPLLRYSIIGAVFQSIETELSEEYLAVSIREVIDRFFILSAAHEENRYRLNLMPRYPEDTECVRVFEKKKLEIANRIRLVFSQQHGRMPAKVSVTDNAIEIVIDFNAQSLSAICLGLGTGDFKTGPDGKFRKYAKEETMEKVENMAEHYLAAMDKSSSAYAKLYALVYGYEKAEKQGLANSGFLDPDGYVEPQSPGISLYPSDPDIRIVMKKRDLPGLLEIINNPDKIIETFYLFNKKTGEYKPFSGVKSDGEKVRAGELRVFKIESYPEREEGNLRSHDELIKAADSTAFFASALTRYGAARNVKRYLITARGGIPVFAVKSMDDLIEHRSSPNYLFFISQDTTGLATRRMMHANIVEKIREYNERPSLKPNTFEQLTKDMCGEGGFLDKHYNAEYAIKNRETKEVIGVYRPYDTKTKKMPDNIMEKEITIYDPEGRSYIGKAAIRVKNAISVRAEKAKETVSIDAADDFAEFLKSEKLSLEDIEIEGATAYPWAEIMNALYKQLKDAGILRGLHAEDHVCAAEEFAVGSFGFMLKYIIERKSREEGIPIFVDMYMAGLSLSEGDIYGDSEQKIINIPEGYPIMRADEIARDYGLTIDEAEQAIYHTSHISAWMPQPVMITKSESPWLTETPIVDEIPISPEDADVSILAYYAALSYYGTCHAEGLIGFKEKYEGRGSKESEDRVSAHLETATWPSPREVPPERRVIMLINGAESAGVNDYFALLARKLAQKGYSLELVKFGLDGLVKEKDEFDKKRAWVSESTSEEILHMPGAVEGTARVKLGDAAHPEYMTNAIRNLEGYCKTIVVVGGNDNMFEATKIANEFKARGIDDMEVIALPKSIDYDAEKVYMIGADTAGTQANRLVIRSAPLPRRAKGEPNKCRVIEVMGRDMGYLTATAGNMAPRDLTGYTQAEVDKMNLIKDTMVVALPEWSFDARARAVHVSLADIVHAVRKKIQKYGAATVVVSEGFKFEYWKDDIGMVHMDPVLEKLLQNPFFKSKFENIGRDEQGNPKLNELAIGDFITQAINMELGEELGLERDNNLQYELLGYSYRATEPNELDKVVADVATTEVSRIITTPEERQKVINKSGVSVAVPRGVKRKEDARAEVMDLPKSRDTTDLKDGMLYSAKELAAANVLGVMDATAPLPEAPTTIPAHPKGWDSTIAINALNSQAESALDM